MHSFFSSAISRIVRTLPTAVAAAAIALHFAGCVPVSEPVAITTILTGAEVVPATSSPATGTANITVDRGLKTISGSVALDNTIVATQVTLNVGAAGNNGAVAVTLTASGNNLWAIPANEKLSSAEFTAIDGGKMHVLVRSAMYPDGEIRGQLPAAGLTPTLASIQKYIFKPTCAVSGCHGGSKPIHGWDLRTETASYNTLVYKPSHIEPGSGLNLVEPGDPDNSFLIRKLEGTANTPRMPMALPALPQSQIDVVRQWISSLPVTPQPTLVYLQKNVFDASCATAGCHRGPLAAAGMDLSAGNTLASVLNIAGSIPGMKRVDAGNPDNSLLWLRVANHDFGPQMPEGANALTPDQIDAIRGWIVSLQPPQPNIEWIQTNLFDSTCAFSGCHDAVTHSFNLDLSPGAAEAELINVPSSIELGEVLVIPGDADNSYLIKKLEHTAANGVGMPWLLPMVAPEKIQAVREWIMNLDGSSGPEPTLSWVQNNVFTPRCTACHGPGNMQAGLNLTEGNALNNLLNVASSQNPAVKRIAGGDPDNSYLVHKLEGTAAGARMPQGGTPLSNEEMTAVRDWIASLPSPPQPTQAWLQANLFNASCTGCHGPAFPQQGLNVSNIATLINVPSSEQPGVMLIAPGNAANSYIVRKLEGTAGISGQRMPLGAPLSTDRIDALKQWINGL